MMKKQKVMKQLLYCCFLSSPHISPAKQGQQQSKQISEAFVLDVVYLFPSTPTLKFKHEPKI